MNPRTAITIASLAVLSIVFVSCSDDQPTPIQPSEHQYLTQEIPPCTPIAGSSVDPCEPDVPPFGGRTSAYLGDQPLSIRELLDDDPPPPALGTPRDVAWHISTEHDPVHYWRSVPCPCLSAGRVRRHLERTFHKVLHRCASERVRLRFGAFHPDRSAVQMDLRD